MQKASQWEKRFIKKWSVTYFTWYLKRTLVYCKSMFCSIENWKAVWPFFFIVSSVINQSRKRRFPDVFRKVFFKFQVKSFPLHLVLCTLVYVCLSEKLKSCLAFFPIVSSVINQSRRRQFPDESPIFWRFWWVKLTLK